MKKIWKMFGYSILTMVAFLLLLSPIACVNYYFWADGVFITLGILSVIIGVTYSLDTND